MIRFLVNPAAGRGRSRRALTLLRERARQLAAGIEVSRSVQDLVEMGRRAVADGVERLLVAGGDGTFHHVAQGLVGSESALGLIPLGRGNDLAAELGIAADVEEAIDFALEGPVRSIDVGRVAGEYFLGYCGMGFDSEAARYANAAPAILGGHLAYVYGVLRTLLSFRAPELVVRGSSAHFEGRAMFVVICNISRFGGGMRIAPSARFDDGWLDLVIARELGRIELLRVFPSVYRGEHVDHPAVLFERVTSVGVAVDRVLGLACDGEPVAIPTGGTIEVGVAPSALRVIAG